MMNKIPLHNMILFVCVFLLWQKAKTANANQWFSLLGHCLRMTTQANKSLEVDHGIFIFILFFGLK